MQSLLYILAYNYREYSVTSQQYYINLSSGNKHGKKCSGNKHILTVPKVLISVCLANESIERLAVLASIHLNVQYKCL